MNENLNCEPASEEKSLSIPGGLMIAYVLLKILCSVMKLVIFNTEISMELFPFFNLIAAAFLGVMLIIGAEGPLMIVAVAPAAASFIAVEWDGSVATALAAAAQIGVILYTVYFHGGMARKENAVIRTLWWIPAAVFTAGEIIPFFGIRIRFYNIPYIAAAIVVSGAYALMLFEMSKGKIFIAPMPEPYQGTSYNPYARQDYRYRDNNQSGFEKPPRPEESWQTNASWNKGTDYNADGSKKADDSSAAFGSCGYENPGFYQGGNYGQNQNNVFRDAAAPNSGGYVPFGRNALEDLRLYKQLLDEGILTQEEFDAKKRQILNL